MINLEGKGEVTFRSYAPEKLDSLKREEVMSLLIESGHWTSLRERPYGKVADPKVVPNSIFITAMDTNPLAPSIEKILVSLGVLFVVLHSSGFYSVWSGRSI